jgi:hypothetical protein
MMPNGGFGIGFAYGLICGAAVAYYLGAWVYHCMIFGWSKMMDFWTGR